MTESARLDSIWLTESSKLDYFTESFCLSIFELAFFLLDISGGGGGNICMAATPPLHANIFQATF